MKQVKVNNKRNDNLKIRYISYHYRLHINIVNDNYNTIKDYFYPKNPKSL